MFSIRSIIISALILLAAYFYSFGLPDFLTPQESGAPAASAQGNAKSGGPSGGRPGGRGAATTVVTTKLTLQPYESILRAIGSSKASKSVTVVSTVAGEITSNLMTANAEVSKGDVLLELDAKTQTLNLNIAKVNLEQAQSTANRYSTIRSAGSSIVTNAELTEANSNLALAKANLGLAQIALDERSIRAPISGRIGLSEVEVGEYISANHEIVGIDQSDTLYVEFELPERSLALLSTEKKILASTPLYTGRVFEGDIISSDSRIDSVTRSVTVKARLDNSDGKLWPGMTFSVRILHSSAPLPALPSTAVSWSRNGSSIWVDNDGTAEQVAATILYRQGETVWIETDVPVGTMVITEGVQKLRNGAKITSAGNTIEKPADTTTKAD